MELLIQQQFSQSDIFENHVIQIGWWGSMGGPKQKGIVQYGLFPASNMFLWIRIYDEV